MTVTYVDTRELDIAYFAALVDGEGTITATRNISNVYRQPTVSSRVSVFNTERSILDELQSHFGGNVQSGRKPQKAVHSQIYEWQLNGRSTLPFLKAILPYLRIKKAHAELAIALGETITQGGGDGLSDRVVYFREQIFEALKELNKKGPKE